MLYRCGRCESEYTWDELDPRAGQFDLLCAGCLGEVRAEAEAEAAAETARFE